MTGLLPLPQEKRDLIERLQAAIAGSSQRLILIKEINKKESVSELIKRLRIPQPTVSNAINSFKSYKLIVKVHDKGSSEVYEKVSLLKQINIDSWVKRKISTEDVKADKLKREVSQRPKFNLPSDIPYLSISDVKTASDMSEPYITIYLLENSLRNFILKILSDKYGSNWWKTFVTNGDLLKKVSDRKLRETKSKWHSIRGSHEIHYTDLGDLPYFINKDKILFENFIEVDLWTTYIRNVVELSRNIVDHHNYLPKKEINRLKQILEDWKTQLR